jgi:limonene-1,2-epoxide hydrolase
VNRARSVRELLLSRALAAGCSMRSMRDIHGQSASGTATRGGIEVVESLMAAWRSNELEGALALLSDDVECRFGPLPARHGKARVERLLRGFMHGVREIDVIMHHIAEREGVVLTERTDILRGPWLELEFWCCGTFIVRDGKITLWRDHFDVGAIALQVISSPLRRLLQTAFRS